MSLQPAYASRLDRLNRSSVAELICREGLGPAKLLDLAVQVVVHGSDAQVRQLLTVASYVEQLWSDRGVEWPAGDSPAQQVDRLLRVLVTKLRKTSPELVPAPLPGEYGDTVESRSAWLGDAALAWQGSVPSGPFGPAGNSEHCRLHVMVVDHDGRGRVAQLTLYRVHRPHAHLGFIAAPSSAFTPCTKSFAASLGSASACVRRFVAGSDARDTAIAWDIAPLHDAVMSALDGPSAGAALAVGAAWLMRASVTDAGLRGDLHRIGCADLVDAPITATIDPSGELGEVAGVLLKAEALRPYLSARQRSIFLHISSRQRDVDDADLRDAGVDIQRFGNLVELIRLVAEHSLEMTPAQRQLLEALLQGDPDDDQVQVDPATVRAVANTDPVLKLEHYALHRWAWWARELEGQLHVRFVPLAIEPDAVELSPDLAGLSGKFKGLADLLAQKNTGNLHGFMLRGQARTGKSTLLKHFEQTLCRRALHAWSRGEPMVELPLYLPLGGLRPEVEPLEWVRKTIGERYPRCDELQALLDPVRRRDGRVRGLRCMLDGLNDLPVRSAEQRPERAREVAHDIWHRLQPGSPMLLSARPHHGFDFRRGGAAMDILPVDLLPWTDRDIQTYLKTATAKDRQILQSYAIQMTESSTSAPLVRSIYHSLVPARSQQSPMQFWILVMCLLFGLREAVVGFAAIPSDFSIQVLKLCLGVALLVFYEIFSKSIQSVYFALLQQVSGQMREHFHSWFNDQVAQTFGRFGDDGSVLSRLRLHDRYNRKYLGFALVLVLIAIPGSVWLTCYDLTDARQIAAIAFDYTILWSITCLGAPAVLRSFLILRSYSKLTLRPPVSVINRSGLNRIGRTILIVSLPWTACYSLLTLIGYGSFSKNLVISQLLLFYFMISVGLVWTLVTPVYLRSAIVSSKEKLLSMYGEHLDTAFSEFLVAPSKDSAERYAWLKDRQRDVLEIGGAAMSRLTLVGVITVNVYIILVGLLYPFFKFDWSLRGVLDQFGRAFLG